MNVLVLYMIISILCSHKVNTSFEYVRFPSLKRLKYFCSRILYYHNSSATFQTEIYQVENQVCYLLLLSGDVETNPCQNYTFPCRKCEKPVKKNQNGLLCLNCQKLYHILNVKI